MKALIISDVHSNIYALEAIWAREQDSDIVFCAGDLVDYGPYPKKVLNWMREQDVTCVQGNHDRVVAATFRSAAGGLEGVPVAERTWARHNASLLDAEDIAFLEQLPRAITLELDGIFYGMTHWYRDYEEIVSLHAFFQFRAQTFRSEDSAAPTRLIFGHTHLQAVRYLSDILLWLNPGSVSYRHGDDPDQAAYYATITDRTISLQRLPYDMTPLRRYIQGVSLKETEIGETEYYFGHRE